MTSPFTDRRRLVGDAYAGPSKLSARQDLYRFRRSGPDFHDRLVDVIDWSAARTVLDVGCGNAIYLDRLLARLPSGATIGDSVPSPGTAAGEPDFGSTSATMPRRLRSDVANASR